MQQTTMDAVVAQHPNVQANAMGMDLDGKYCILGTRRHLILIDLDKPKEIARRFNRQSNWDVTQIQWNPCFTKKEYFVTTYNQSANLWTWHEGAGSLLATLKGHTRVISDVDWSPQEENLLATCSIDTYIYVWDIRDTKRPKMTSSAVAGASQVKWNKQVPHVLATAHDGDIRIWDIRNCRTPTQYITAHLSKIHSLDWSPMDQETLASSGQDATVRFWDTSQPSLQSNCQISAGAPVWKARYTPFGYGMVTTLMPQMQRWDNSVLLWNVQNVSSVVHSYVGHRDVILDFGWRCKQEDTNAELVTWSKDHSLMIWKCDSSILTACGCADMEDDDLDGDVDLYDVIDDINIALEDQEGGLKLSLDNRATQQSSLAPSAGTDYNTSRKSDSLKSVMTPRSGTGSYRPQDIQLGTSPHGFSSSPSYGGAPSPVARTAMQPTSLEREFNLMNIDLQNLYIEEVDVQHRTCVASVQSNFTGLKVRVTFPPQYPKNTAPNFQFFKATNISQTAMSKLSNMLREIAQNHVRSHLTCLEPCLRTLSNQVESMSHSEMFPQDFGISPYSSMKTQPGFGPYGTYQHLVNIPFPRTSGARFCGAGHLVTFMRPTQVKGFEANPEPTPRCLAALMTFRNNNLVQKHVKPYTVATVQSNHVQYGSSPTTENSEISVKSFYYKEKKSRKPWKHHMKDTTTSSSDPASEKLQLRLHKAAGKVVIQDLSQSLQLNRKLAEVYVVPTKHNYIEACMKNKEAAEKFGKKDLVELWSTLELIQSSVIYDTPSLISSFPPVASTNLGKGLLVSLIDHYSKLLDVQTLAMISCMFAPEFDIVRHERSFHPWHSVGSPMDRSTSCNSIEIESSNSSHRSNSFCENSGDTWWFKPGPSPPTYYPSYIESPTDDYRYAESPSSDIENREQDHLEKQKQLLDYTNQAQYDAFKQAYADILDRWGLVNQKTEILKYKSQPPYQHAGLIFVMICQHCGSDTALPQCSTCRKFAMSCSLCQLPVKKLISFCYRCGHGGHPEHMKSWFETSSLCATGCGCECRPPPSVKVASNDQDTRGEI